MLSLNAATIERVFHRTIIPDYSQLNRRYVRKVKLRARFCICGDSVVKLPLQGWCRRSGEECIMLLEITFIVGATFVVC